MFHIIVDIRNQTIFGFNDSELFNNQLESLGSNPYCDYFHISGLDDIKYDNMLYTLNNSYHYQNYKIEMIFADKKLII
jgi:hypothetical protein